MTKSQVSGPLLAALLTGACLGEVGVTGGEATSHDTGTTTSSTSEPTTSGPTSSTTGDTSGTTAETTVGTTAETTATSTSTSATTGDTEGATTEAGTTEASSTDTDTDTTTGGIGGCQGPSDPDKAWSRSAGTPDSLLRAQLLAVDHTGAVVMSDRFRGVLDLGGVPLDVDGIPQSQQSCRLHQPPTSGARTTSQTC